MDSTLRTFAYDEAIRTAVRTIANRRFEELKAAVDESLPEAIRDLERRRIWTEGMDARRTLDFGTSPLLADEEFDDAASAAVSALDDGTSSSCDHLRMVVALNPPVKCHRFNSKFFRFGDEVAEVCADCCDLGLLNRMGDPEPVPTTTVKSTDVTREDLGHLEPGVELKLCRDGTLVAVGVSKNVPRERFGLIQLKGHVVVESVDIKADTAARLDDDELRAYYRRNLKRKLISQ